MGFIQLLMCKVAEQSWDKILCCLTLQGWSCPPGCLYEHKCWMVWSSCRQGHLVRCLELLLSWTLVRIFCPRRPPEYQTGWWGHWCWWHRGWWSSLWNMRSQQHSQELETLLSQRRLEVEYLYCQGRPCIGYHKSFFPFWRTSYNPCWTTEDLERCYSWRRTFDRRHQWSIAGIRRLLQWFHYRLQKRWHHLTNGSDTRH